MTWYLALELQQEPQDLGGLDDNGRVQVGFNVVALGRRSTDWLRELLSLLVAAGVGVVGTNIFATSLDTVPPGAGPYLHVRSTAGVAPVGTHNDGPGAYRRPAAQLIVSARDYDAAMAMAEAAYEALLPVRNRSVVA